MTAGASSTRRRSLRLAVATSNGPRSAFEWFELARKYLFGPTERDWFCAYLVTAGLARFLYVEYETLKGEGTGKAPRQPLVLKIGPFLLAPKGSTDCCATRGRSSP